MIITLQQRLQQYANSNTKAWWERYLKHVIPFRGVKMADIRKCLHAWYKTEKISEHYSSDDQIDLALTLLQEEYAEDKLAGILFLQEILLPADAIEWQRDLPRFAALFHGGFIADWNICDWFCVKVLGPLAQQQGETCVRAIAAWKAADTLWQRRAAGVAFINLAKAGDANFPGFVEIVLDVCATTVQSPERFAQTGTGWVLRELSMADETRVVQFIETHLIYFSREGLRYATEKLSEEEKSPLMQRHKKKKKIRR